jgi:hypothetical protein
MHCGLILNCGKKILNPPELLYQGFLCHKMVLYHQTLPNEAYTGHVEFVAIFGHYMDSSFSAPTCACGTVQKSICPRSPAAMLREHKPFSCTCQKLLADGLEQIFHTKEYLNE